SLGKKEPAEEDGEASVEVKIVPLEQRPERGRENDRTERCSVAHGAQLFYSALPMKRLTIGVGACTEILALLIAIAWADDELKDEEKEGVRGAAVVLNLPKELRDRLEAMLAKQSTL